MGPSSKARRVELERVRSSLLDEMPTELVTEELLKWLDGYSTLAALRSESREMAALINSLRPAQIDALFRYWTDRRLLSDEQAYPTAKFGRELLALRHYAQRRVQFTEALGRWLARDHPHYYLPTSRATLHAWRTVANFVTNTQSKEERNQIDDTFHQRFYAWTSWYLGLTATGLLLEDSISGWAEALELREPIRVQRLLRKKKGAFVVRRLVETERVKAEHGDNSLFVFPGGGTTDQLRARKLFAVSAVEGRVGAGTPTARGADAPEVAFCAYDMEFDLWISGDDYEAPSEGPDDLKLAVFILNLPALGSGRKRANRSFTSNIRLDRKPQLSVAEDPTHSDDINFDVALAEEECSLALDNTRKTNAELRIPLCIGYELTVVAHYTVHTRCQIVGAQDVDEWEMTVTDTIRTSVNELGYPVVSRTAHVHEIQLLNVATLPCDGPWRWYWQSLTPTDQTINKDNLLSLDANDPLRPFLERYVKVGEVAMRLNALWLPDKAQSSTQCLLQYFRRYAIPWWVRVGAAYKRNEPIEQAKREEVLIQAEESAYSQMSTVDVLELLRLNLAIAALFLLPSSPLIAANVGHVEDVLVRTQDGPDVKVTLPPRTIPKVYVMKACALCGHSAVAFVDPAEHLGFCAPCVRHHGLL